MSVPVVRFAKVHPDAHIPKRMTPGAAGLDLFAFVEQPPGFPSPINPKGMGITVEPHSVAVVRTGVRVAIPPGYEGQVRPRSGLARAHRVTVLNAPGTIDADYRGELEVLLINHGVAPVMFFTGERIAQLVIAPVAMLEVAEVADLEATERGTSGFGSTGR